MAKNLLIIQHEDSTPPGTTTEWARRRGIAPRILRADAGEFPAPGRWDGVILLGGEMNVDQEGEFPWLAAEKKFIRELLSTDVPTLGICLGAQLIAEVLGARVSRHAFEEKGLESVRIQPGLGLPDEGRDLPVMQWHAYSFDCPAGARPAFTGEAWENQGFKSGDRVLATQFHPEADADFVEQCYADARLVRPPDLEARRLAMQDWYFRLLDSHFTAR